MPGPETVLPRPPRLTAAYARAVLPRRRRPDAPLPDRSLALAAAVPHPDRVRAYARLCGAPDDDRLPVGYPHLLAFPLTMALLTAPDFPCPPLGLVQLANEISCLRPLAAAEPLAVRVTAVAAAPRPRGRAFEVRAEVSDARGLPVWRGSSTYLHRSGPGGAARGAGRAPDAEPALDSPALTARWPLAAGLGRRYARVSGDRNPIHLHPLTARPFGFRRPIAHGMWSKARALAALADELPEAFTARARFLAPVPLPSRPAFAATPRAGGGWLFQLSAADGRRQLAGEIVPH
ncbi:MaoC/PaaZ C-terminal domain-containing protein [Streptomyces sp. DSM 44915]|uniref:MaoC/PaaZ C-terminal domain-containing protein n=1 Tax=Streptomyces chisholmiae TaxID=3075540 RepID=A0ABU2JN69_9ACTN|nr:MaoC/PaaZ C-terminal domain-containing protein [Streptomyces sp. DSM 44915]MDT0266433.1 MaoC/PaaZ C-terminal domain-containing protein [Streptomyces sp. DSM 44915]